MAADFESFPERKNTRSAKWDMVETLFGSKEVQPMWVADMDLTIADSIKQKLIERVEHGIFGYTLTDDTLHGHVKQWIYDQHQWEINKDWIVYSPGVIPTLHMAVLTQTKPGDKIVIQTPVYPPFYSIIESHDREIVKNPLVYENNRYTMDFDHLEDTFKQGVQAIILCNPHNPVGRVWTKEELEKLTALCLAYDVLILSDEIHADLIYSGNKHTPISSLSESVSQQTVTCLSPTKTFNLAGLQVSYAIIPNKRIRTEIQDAFKKYGITMVNTMGVTALEAAYTEGKDWLNGLLQLLETNRNLVVDAFADREEITAIRAEGTYLIWLDCTNMNLSHDDLKRFMQEEAKVGLNDGASFGEEGKGFMRINIASPTAYVQEGVNKILHALDQRKNK
ncbi:cystathionine beta-lyase PatB [Paraliobacillus ryukyuensis]|uniref:cysteine-S-conjugate beta-lyase n=1 Tax=Paraliobacillus ryukyuensis TaxID=200904 RepID=A0A366E6U0_9BACI|nr:MalY/PatB family protein [Paraliobacillus ryukyuensis]RBO98111.1 cystathionine beta-lyase [Paraliobacillus ryukyuensis]